MAEEMINQALAIDPHNALALHLHVHIAEASSPQRHADARTVNFARRNTLSARKSCFTPAPLLRDG